MNVAFVCSTPPLYEMPSPKNKSNNQPYNPYLKPAWIASMSSLGLVQIDFYLPLFVPNFTNSAFFSNKTRRLGVRDPTLSEVINADVIGVQLLTN